MDFTSVQLLAPNLESSRSEVRAAPADHITKAAPVVVVVIPLQVSGKLPASPARSPFFCGCPIDTSHSHAADSPGEFGAAKHRQLDTPHAQRH